jgi:hypothetical protein
MVKGFMMFPQAGKGARIFANCKSPENDSRYNRTGQGTNLMVTTWSAQSANIETYQGEIKQKYGSNFKVPVVY